MDDILFYMILSSSILTILFIITLLRKRNASEDDDDKETKQKETSKVPSRMERGPAPVRRVGGIRVARKSRLTPSSASSAPSNQMEDMFDTGIIDEDVEDDDEDDDGSDTSKPFASDQKIGAKKRKKLEMKAEKRAQREQEVSEREDRLKRKAQLEEKRKQEEEAEAAEKAKQLEEEKRLQKAKEEQEHEEYLKLKATFEIESSGFEEQPLDNGTDLLNDFIQHIIKEKVVLLEDLALMFKLKTQDVIDRINNLLESKQLTGVVDDRGKFIYISKEELLAISKFIHQRGRVTISELAESSNSLIMMGHKQKDVVTTS